MLFKLCSAMGNFKLNLDFWDFSHSGFSRGPLAAIVIISVRENDCESNLN